MFAPLARIHRKSIRIIPESEQSQMTTTEKPIETVETESDRRDAITALQQEEHQWSRPLTDNEISDDIAAAIRQTLTEDQKMAILRIAENILEKVVENEVREAFSTRFEAMYEGVIANVMQKLLMQALTERQSAALKSITGG